MVRLPVCFKVLGRFGSEGFSRVYLEWLLCWVSGLGLEGLFRV